MIFSIPTWLYYYSYCFLQLPNGANNQQFQEKRAKIEEGLKHLNLSFKMLRVMYDKVNELVPDPDDPAEEVGII